MKRTLYSFIVFSICIITGVSCKKGEVINNPPPGPSDTIVAVPLAPDSVRLLVTVDGNFSSGDKFVFEYDSLNELTKFYRPYSFAKNNPCYVYYTQGKVNHILCVASDNLVSLSSMIYTYGANKKPANIYYKMPVYQISNPPDAYFTTVDDGNVLNMDSLTYTANNFIAEIYHFYVFQGISLTSTTKFNYSSNTDSIPFSLEEYHFDDTGNKFLYDQLIITTDSIANPYYTQDMGYMAFVNTLSVITGSGGNVMVPPIIYNDPSTYLSPYAALLPKCLAHYKVNNNWGSYNYSSGFSYAYNADSSLLKSTLDQNAGVYVNYNFTKRKRR